MDRVRASAPQLQGLIPYDPKYLPAEVMISANENPLDVPSDIRREIERAIRKLPFNRYPDPLANDLRDLIAEANGLDRNQVLLGNGGDELLFNMALAWGGPGRTLLNLPPTFSVYAANARLTGTTVVDIPRRADYSVDEDAVVDRLQRCDIDFAIVNSPNNPTGNTIGFDAAERILDASDALVMIDEAYFEFSRNTVRPLLQTHKNLIILRTFSKAFSLAGVRLGYVLASAEVIDEFLKVRQPYSVDAVSQTIGRVVYENRAAFEPGIDAMVSERARMLERFAQLPGITAYPSDANYIMFRIEGAAQIWQKLYDAGVLVRDFSATPRLEDCLRVSIGTEQENNRFLEVLESLL